jgi:hypothetical protein
MNIILLRVAYNNHIPFGFECLPFFKRDAAVAEFNRRKRNDASRIYHMTLIEYEPASAGATGDMWVANEGMHMFWKPGEMPKDKHTLPAPIYVLERWLDGSPSEQTYYDRDKVLADYDALKADCTSKKPSHPLMKSITRIQLFEMKGDPDSGTYCMNTESGVQRRWDR